MVIFISEFREPFKSYFKVACTGTDIITKVLTLSQPNECRLSLAILKVQSTFTNMNKLAREIVALETPASVSLR